MEKESESSTELSPPEASELLAKCESDSDEAFRALSIDDPSKSSLARISKANVFPVGRKELLEWLDGLPLAIESVGRRIRNTGISYEKMLKTLKTPTLRDNQAFDDKVGKICEDT